ncbi:MAG TPA: tRNA-dihydrouridine synthase [Candidatus Limnocylindria bacterium]|nr:tRNA-dihydrouridine synthase [Candidatus Limnocylindria bacterium]
MDIWDELPAPFFVLAPMDDVTDTVFRQVIAACAPPDLFFTEFVNVDALQSQGREATLKRLKFTDTERPIIAQVWGLNPENFRKSAADIAAMGYDGLDLNFGCPEKNVVKNGACSALIRPENRERALEIIQACREGAPALPLSVKTRLGFSEVDLSWHELLLGQKLNALTIHGRTRKQMSKVPADWDVIGRIAEMRTSLSPATKIVGNGDVLTRQQGEELAQKHGVDGIMVGRGIFHDPFLFAPNSPWGSMSKEQKTALYAKHVKLFADTWQQNERKIHTLNKFCKIYINGFDGAKELREKLMAANSTDELLEQLV